MCTNMSRLIILLNMNTDGSRAEKGERNRFEFHNITELYENIGKNWEKY